MLMGVVGLMKHTSYLNRTNPYRIDCMDEKDFWNVFTLAAHL